MSQAEPKPTKTETLFGGVDVPVKLADGSTEQARVRQLPVRKFPDYRAALTDEPALVALLTGKDSEWVDSLSAESFEAIVLEGQRVNGDFFGRWEARQAKERERAKASISETVDVMQHLSEKNPALFEKVIAQAVSSLPTTSRTSPQKPG